MDKPDETTVEMAKHFAMGNSNRIELIESGRKYLRYLIRQQRTHQIPNQPLHCGIETWLKFNSRGAIKDNLPGVVQILHLAKENTCINRYTTNFIFTAILPKLQSY